MTVMESFDLSSIVSERKERVELLVFKSSLKFDFVNLKATMNFLLRTKSVAFTAID